MDRFELASDFVINHTLKPHVHTNFRVDGVAPGRPLHRKSKSKGGAATTTTTTTTTIYPKILTTGSGNAVHLPPIFRKLLSMTGKDRPNVVYVGTPFFDRDDKYDTGTAPFRALGCGIERLMVAKECTTPSPEEMRRIVVDWADLVMVSGGNSLFAMLRWQSIGLDQLLREAASNGTVMCGGSAGCGCWFDSMQTDSLKPEACKLAEKVLTDLSAEERLDWSFVRITCMGYINAFCVPHIDTTGTNGIARVDIAKKMLLEHYNKDDDSPMFGLGVDEQCAVVYEEGKVTIMSAGRRKTGIGEATAHILFVNERTEVMVIPFTPNTGEALTLEEMLERAKREVDAVQSPLDLMTNPDVNAACHRRGCSGNLDMIGILDDAGVASVTAVATMGMLERAPSLRGLQISKSLDSGEEEEEEKHRPHSHHHKRLPSLVEGKRLVPPEHTAVRC